MKEETASASLRSTFRVVVVFAVGIAHFGLVVGAAPPQGRQIHGKYCTATAPAG